MRKPHLGAVVATAAILGTTSASEAQGCGCGVAFWRKGSDMPPPWHSDERSGAKRGPIRSWAAASPSTSDPTYKAARSVAHRKAIATFRDISRRNVLQLNRPNMKSSKERPGVRLHDYEQCGKYLLSVVLDPTPFFCGSHLLRVANWHTRCPKAVGRRSKGIVNEVIRTDECPPHTLLLIHHFGMENERLRTLPNVVVNALLEINSQNCVTRPSTCDPCTLTTSSPAPTGGQGFRTCGDT